MLAQFFVLLLRGANNLVIGSWNFRWRVWLPFGSLVKNVGKVVRKAEMIHFSKQRERKEHGTPSGSLNMSTGRISHQYLKGF